MSLVWNRWIWLALIGLQLLWFGVLAPPQQVPVWIMLAVMTLPLLLMAVWVMRLNSRGLVVGGLVLLLYFCLAVAEAWVNPLARAPALMQVALIMLYFVVLFRAWRRARRV